MFQGFQRLKAGIDSRIAEEQARQRSLASTPQSRSNSTGRRPGVEPPARRPRKPRPKDDDGNTKGPDPSEFEAAFVIGDESEAPSRVGTPAVGDEKSKMMADTVATPEGGTPVEEKEPEAIPRTSSDLPPEIHAKLRRSEKIEARYQELLDSYKIAHRRASLVEPFERALRESTPLTTIKDPDALVEYLNQLNLKGDMVMEELKRVTGDRHEFQKKLEEAEKQIATLQKESAVPPISTDTAAPTESSGRNSIDTPSTSVKSPVSSIRRIFSPVSKAEPFPNKEASEEFFSYDDEIPKLQATVEAKNAEVEELKSKVSTLEKDLAIAQESSSGLIANLEQATRELNELKEVFTATQTENEKAQKDVLEWKEKLEKSDKTLDTIRTDLESQKKVAEDKAVELDKQRNEYETKLNVSKSVLSSQKESHFQEVKTLTNARNEVERIKADLETQLKELKEAKDADSKRILELSNEGQDPNVAGDASTPADSTPAPGATTSAAKKKNKKKKKGPNAGAANDSATPIKTNGKAINSGPFQTGGSDLQAEISQLKKDLADRDAQITKLQSTRKTEADLREELENMQDNFLTVGQEHVQAKEKIKELQAEKDTLQTRITELEKELASQKSSSTASEKTEADYKSLTAEYEDLKLKTTTLQTDLGAAQQLATARYKDLTELKDVLQKAQPELKTLRAENATLKSTKDELMSRTSELRRLEAREKDLRADIASFKKQATDSTYEIRTLNEKVVQESNSRLRAEDQARYAQRDMRKAEADNIQLAASSEKANTELAKVQGEAGNLRTRVRELEDQVETLGTESKGLREEVELRGSQYNNAQGLLGSMRDQTSEMAMQLKEAKEQSESLEEELGEVQRLLSERTREGETMRRLLADVDDRADAKVREMRERMEAAVEERDRAEDEASTNARRRAREADELKNKIGDLERDVKRAVDDRDELQRLEKDWKRRRDELKSASEKTTQEANDIRSAMSELRGTLDTSEKQARDAEKQRAELRRILDEANQRYEKLQKEFKTLQAKQSRLNDVSSRSSIDSGRGGGVSSVNGAAAPVKMDYVYLKTILLQFLEQKDKRVKTSLVNTVLGQLLQFDKKDQEKWIAAISAM